MYASCPLCETQRCKTIAHLPEYRSVAGRAFPSRIAWIAMDVI